MTSHIHPYSFKAKGTKSKVDEKKDKVKRNVLSSSEIESGYQPTRALPCVSIECHVITVFKSSELKF